MWSCVAGAILFGAAAMEEVAKARLQQQRVGTFVAKGPDDHSRRERAGARDGVLPSVVRVDFEHPRVTCNL